MGRAPWDGVLGEAAATMATVDWAQSSLGPVSTWSQALCTAVDILLHSPHPMFLFWGPERTQLYNDAYRPSLGRPGEHPEAMGRPGPVWWQEAWASIGPQIDDAIGHQRSSWNEDQLVPVWRSGRLEDVYWTYSFFPVRDDDGEVGSALVVCTETTRRVLADRRLQCARRVAHAGAQAHTMEELAAAAALALAARRGSRPRMPCARRMTR